VIGLDTNVLVRYLTQDDAQQAAKANAVVAEAASGGGRCYIDPIVLCELTWVLREAYERPKADLIKTLDLMLATRQFEIGDKDAVRQAVEAYRTGRADFADYLIGGRNLAAGCGETVTFDRRLDRTTGFRRL
jgi:predicted nucleic-acid-binding protein